MRGRYFMHCTRGRVGRRYSSRRFWRRQVQIWAHERFLMTGTFMRFIINKKEIEKGD